MVPILTRSYGGPTSHTHHRHRADCVRPRSPVPTPVCAPVVACSATHRSLHAHALMLSDDRWYRGRMQKGWAGWVLPESPGRSQMERKAGSLRGLAMLRRAADLKCRSPRCAGLPPPSLPGSRGARCRPRRPFFGRALPAPANPSLIARALSLVRDKASEFDPGVCSAPSTHNQG